MQSVKTVPCPRCGAPARFDPQNKWRPFCSERCKTIDLGDWAAEKFRVPAEEKGSEQISQNPPDPADKQ